MASQKIKTFSKRDEIIRLLGSITGAYSIYNVFDDWIKNACPGMLSAN